MGKSFKRILLLLTSLLLCGAVQLYAQNNGSKKDSLPGDFVTRMKAFAKTSAQGSAAEFAADKATITQNRVFEDIKKTMQRAKIYLRKGFDTLNVKAGFAAIEKDFTIAADGVLVNKPASQNYRNLTASSKILVELLSKAISRKIRLDTDQQNLHNFRYQLDSLLSIPALFAFPSDSTALAGYLQQILAVAEEVHPIDSSLKQAALKVQTLQTHVNRLVFKLQSGLEEMAQYEQDIVKSGLTRESDNIWSSKNETATFKEIAKQSRDKSILTLVFYLENNNGKLLILLLLFLGCFVYLRSLKNIYKEQGLLTEDLEGKLVLRYPLLSALVIVINLFQFIFFSPPFILNVILWTIACISLTIVFKNFITRYWMAVWLIMVVLFLLSACDNLLLQSSYAERIFMLLMSLLGIASGTIAIVKGRKNELREKLIVVAIGFMVVLELGATITNMFGRYNLSKTLLISGYLNVVIAILFLWTIRLINEGLYLAFNVYKKQEPKLFYLNFDKVGKKAPALFYVLLVFAWIVLFGRNFAGFESIVGPIQEFFTTDRTLGDYSFSINKLLLFIAIITISVIISKIVSFFASDKHVYDKDKNTGPGIGSWLLLIRISILSIGLFLALAAAGIPLDRITIVLGALGVGIGFGLQTLVNNLVSGLIIAFEKPVNVGDVVDIDGQGGTMKSIGFRSSVISTWDGADVVMPNGDLLNSHLINWSLGGNRRRMSVGIGIAYDADLQKIKELLNDVLDNEQRLSKSPGPVVQYEQFRDNFIEVKIFFWTKHLREAYATRSDLIMAITAQFRANGIVIPFQARQDVYLHQPGNDKNKDESNPS
jgi:potassium efflux system protein